MNYLVIFFPVFLWIRIKLCIFFFILIYIYLPLLKFVNTILLLSFRVYLVVYRKRSALIGNNGLRSSWRVEKMITSNRSATETTFRKFDIHWNRSKNQKTIAHGRPTQSESHSVGKKPSTAKRGETKRDGTTCCKNTYAEF